MANEITASIALSCSKNSAAISVTASKTFDMTGDDMLAATQIIGTSTEALDLGDITVPAAYIYIRNLDPTNFITLSIDNANADIFAKIRPGHFAMFPPPQTGPIYATANTGDCSVQVAACEQ